MSKKNETTAKDELAAPALITEAATQTKVAATPDQENAPATQPSAPESPVEPEAVSDLKSAKLKKKPADKPKMIRDSFSIPEPDYALFAQLKKRALDAGIEVKKSELLRAALKALQALDADGFAHMLASVERMKTGRPKK